MSERERGDNLDEKLVAFYQRTTPIVIARNSSNSTPFWSNKFRKWCAWKIIHKNKSETLNSSVPSIELYTISHVLTKDVLTHRGMPRISMSPLPPISSPFLFYFFLTFPFYDSTQDIPLLPKNIVENTAHHNEFISIQFYSPFFLCCCYSFTLFLPHPSRNQNVYRVWMCQNGYATHRIAPATTGEHKNPTLKAHGAMYTHQLFLTTEQ